MKKTFLWLLCIFIIVTAFSSCKKNSYELTESEIEHLYSDEKEQKNTVPPVKDEIMGLYMISGRDYSSNRTEWQALVSDKGGKTVIQIIERSAAFEEPDETALSNIISEYDESTGHFIQKYTTNVYISSYDAYFYKEEDGRIRLSVHNQYIYSTDEDANSGLTAQGYKQ